MPEHASFAIQVLIAVGTIGAVIVALFGDFLKPRPKLTMKISDRLGYPAHVQSNSSSTKIPARFYHLRVENRRRWVKATGVQIYLTHIQKLGPDREYHTEWAGEIPMRWRYQESNPVQRVIGSGIECDLCGVVQGKHIQLQPLIYPDEFPHQWDPEITLVLTLHARSIEADSKDIYVRISWDGVWKDGKDEMKEHMRVKEIPEIKNGSVDA